MRTQLPFALLATTLACTLASTAAHARARVFVASFGNDANACTFGSPCKTFQQAVNVVDPGGEVTAIDSAGFGPINITKAVTITSPGGVEAGIVPAANGMAININAGPSDKINLRGLVIDGTGTATNGINFIAGDRLNVQDSVIRNFAGDGIFFGPNASSKLSMSNTLVSNNSVNGVSVGPTGSVTVDAVLDHVELDSNGNGLHATGNGNGILRVILSNSVSSHNSVGVLAASQPGTTAVMVQSSIIAGNGTGLRADGTAAAITATRSTITANELGISDSTGATVSSKDNLLTDNNIDQGFKFTISLE